MKTVTVRAAAMVTFWGSWKTQIEANIYDEVKVKRVRTI